MDLTPILIPMLQGPGKQLLAGLIVAVLVQAAKKLDGIPLPENNAKAVLMAAQGFSLAASVATGYASGNLASLDLTAAGNVIADFLVISLLSAGSWATFLKGKK